MGTQALPSTVNPRHLKRLRVLEKEVHAPFSVARFTLYRSAASCLYSSRLRDGSGGGFLPAAQVLALTVAPSAGQEGDEALQPPPLRQIG